MDKRTVNRLILERTKLLVEESKYQYIKDFSCTTEEEFNIFFNKNRAGFEDLKRIRVRLRQIKWELMSEKEKSDYKENSQKLKNKFKG